MPIAVGGFLTTDLIRRAGAGMFVLTRPEYIAQVSGTSDMSRSDK